MGNKCKLVDTIVTQKTLLRASCCTRPRDEAVVLLLLDQLLIRPAILADIVFDTSSVNTQSELESTSNTCTISEQHLFAWPTSGCSRLGGRTTVTVV